VKHAREAVLKEDLHTMRSAIDSYTYDKQKAPQSLDDLVTSGYLKELPKDPFTQRNDTWIADQGTDYTSIDETQSGGITDVHSGSQQVSTEGTTYNSW
jgi:general secretion pathway protein G